MMRNSHNKATHAIKNDCQLQTIRVDRESADKVKAVKSPNKRNVKQSDKKNEKVKKRKYVSSSDDSKFLSSMF